MNISKKRKLNMDPNSVISTFIASSNQYVVCQNETNLMQLKRHLEIIVCLTTTSSDLGFFQSGNPLASQCITHIVNLLLDTNAKCTTLIPRVLSILQNLSKCSEINKSLQTVYHVHSAVSVFLQNYSTDVKDLLVLESLYLLENVTYNIRIDYVESHFESLIKMLLKLIDTESSQLLKVALCILTNLTRHNAKVQDYIFSLPSAKQNVKKIVAMLNTEEPQVLVYTLSILANLSPNYSIVAKLWTEDHLINTFKLIFKLLFAGNETCATAALDLFLDLIKVSKYQCCFTKAPNLKIFLKRIPKNLIEMDDKKSIMYMQVLYALVKIPDCKEKVCSLLYVTDSVCTNADISMASADIKIHPKIVQWCTSKDTNDKASKISLKLLKSVLNLHIVGNFSCIENSTKDIIKNILENMCVPLVTKKSLLKEQLAAHISIFEILILLCEKTDLKPYIAEYANMTIFKQIANVLLDKCRVDDTENDVSCINLFLMVMEVMSMIEDILPNSEKLSYEILQDLKAMQYLAYALTCNNSKSVKRGILLISLIKNESSLSVLSNYILVRNTNLQKQFTPNSGTDGLDTVSFSSDIVQLPKQTNSSTANDSFEKTIDSLLVKIEQGLNIKEFKRSEIMDLYEHKIAILTRKEQELQNYIEAKTAALQKADQIMTQYKCRQADSDSEALRLRTMLKDYESRCEKAVLKFELAQKESKKQKNELEAALLKVKELQQYQNEQKDLMQSQMTRQYEQKKTFEEEKVRMSELLHVKDSEKKALSSQLQQMEEDMKLKNKAIEFLEESKDELTKRIEENQKSTDKMKSNFEQKQLNLENALEAAQQAIASLEEKNENITNEMNAKIEEYNQKILGLEGDKDELREQIKVKDSKIVDLNESIKKLNSLLDDKDSNLKEAELSNDRLKSALEKTENKNIKLEQDVKMLELLCKRYETSLEKKDNEMKSLTDELEDVRKQYEEMIEEKEGQVKHMEDELEKYKYITGMINQMTSGKVPPQKPSK